MIDLKSLVLYTQNTQKKIEDNFCDESSVYSLFRPNNQIITFNGYKTYDKNGYRMFSNIRLYDSDDNLYKMSKTGPVYYESSLIQHFILTRNKNDMKTDVNWVGKTKAEFEKYKCKDGELKIKISSDYVNFICMFIDGLSTNYSDNSCGHFYNAKKDFTCTLTITGYSIIKKFGFNNFGTKNNTTRDKGFRSIKLTNTINDELKRTIEKSLPNTRVAYTLDI